MCGRCVRLIIIRSRLVGAGQMQKSTESHSVEWLIQAIRRLPSDERAPGRQQGYNNYNTQKDHWLGWLDPNSKTGTYRRKSGQDRGARYVYNQIGEPKMLLWLASAAGVRHDLLSGAERAANSVSSVRSKCGAIRRVIPWSEVAVALSIR